MRRCMAGLLASAILVLALTGAATAQAPPHFRLGFKTLAEQIPEIVGQPTENEHYAANGDALQRTTSGLMVWRNADNWTAFTDGSRTWISGAAGVADRANNERFPWERDVLEAAPTSTPAARPVALQPTPQPTSVPFGGWSPGPEASGPGLSGVIDSPKPGERVSGAFSVSGWALDGRAATQSWNGIDDVRVTLEAGDGTTKRVDTSWSHSERRDVAAALGNAGYARSGFAVKVDVSALAPGWYVLYVAVHSTTSGWWSKTASVVTVVVEQPAVGTVTMDGKQYTTSLAWGRLMDDPYLRGALAYAYHYYPDWRKLADAAASRGTRVQWGQLPRGVGGLYRTSDNTITINSDYRTEYTGAVAAILAHEAFHAAGAPREGALGCLQDEVYAFSWEAGIWSSVPKMRPAATALERNLDMVVYYWRMDSLNDYVITTSGYQQQCMGGELVNP